MKRALIVGLMVALVFMAGVRFGISYFSDVAKSENNSLSTGQFDIGISRDGSRYYDDYKIFEFGDILPGEERTVHFYVKNRGDYPISTVSLVLNVTDLEDGLLSRAEALVDSTPNVGELSKYLIIKDINVTFNGTTVSLDQYRGKSLRELNDTQIVLFNGEIPENKAMGVTITFELSPDAGNDCQTDTSKVSMLITASQ